MVENKTTQYVSTKNNSDILYPGYNIEKFVVKCVCWLYSYAEYSLNVLLTNKSV